MIYSREKPFSSESIEDIEKQQEEEKAFHNEKEIEEGFKEFGLTKEDLAQIPGFNDLSVGQKLLVLENLKQITLGRIQEEAREKYKQEIEKAKFLGRLWRGISKKYQIAKLERVTAKEILKGGLNAHKEVLEQLVQGVKSTGLEIEKTPEGELEIQYISKIEDLTEEEKEEIKEFNKAANQFTKIPYEWSLETASKKEQKRFKKVFEEYQKAREKLFKLLRKRKSEKEVLLTISDIESKIKVNQFLNTNPEIEKELQRITSKKPWRRIFKDVITERGLYFGVGFATRSATVSLLGFLGAPIATGVVAGWLARKRAKQELKEKEVLARKGVKDISKEAKNFVDAERLTEKIESLLKRIQETEDPSKKAKLLNSLDARLEYTKGKIEKGLVNFGKKEERIKNMYNLADALNSGFVVFTAEREKAIAWRQKPLGRISNIGEIEKALACDLKYRLERFLKYKERKISSARKRYLRNQMLKGAILGAGTATIGYVLRYVLGEVITDSLKEVKEPVEVVQEKPKIMEIKVPPIAAEIRKKAVEVAKKGDSIWKMINRQLKKEFEERFTNLEDSQKIYIIDALKDKIAENPQKFGLKDIDTIKPGQKIDFTEIFKDRLGINKIFEKARNLTKFQKNNIMKNFRILKEWIEKNPNTRLTSKKVEEILKGLKK